MSLTWQDYLSNEQYRADNQSLKDFAEKLMLAFKQKNISEGINVVQATHLHARMRAWVVTLPPSLGGGTFTVDILNMVVAGDLETATTCLIYGTPDDMTEPHHWLSADRIGWLNLQLTTWLGWT